MLAHDFPDRACNLVGGGQRRASGHIDLEEHGVGIVVGQHLELDAHGRQRPVEPGGADELPGGHEHGAGHEAQHYEEGEGALGAGPDQRGEYPDVEPL